MAEPGLEQELQQLQNVYNLLTEFLVKYSFQLIGAILIFLIGLWLASKAARLIARQLEKHKVDITLSNFITNLVRILVIVMVGIIALGKLGISITPMVAAIGAASLGAGLALQGMLSNYAAGITIIVTRPFIVGNTLSVKGVTGVVQDIHLGLTILTNEEGERISIPNKHIVGEILHNSYENKLVETHFNLSYQCDLEQAIALIQQVLNQSLQVSREKEPQIGVNDFNSVGVEIGIRYWVPTQSYYQDKYQINLALIRAMKAANIEIPRPLQQVSILERR